LFIVPAIKNRRAHKVADFFKPFFLREKMAASFAAAQKCAAAAKI
jgi:hypothetical protein